MRLGVPRIRHPSPNPITFARKASGVAGVCLFMSAVSRQNLCILGGGGATQHIRILGGNADIDTPLGGTP